MRKGSGPQESWAVSVERNGQNVVTIASNHLSGRTLSADDERVIEQAARSLLSFLGLNLGESRQLQWVLDNIYTVARREIRRFEGGINGRPEMWAHVRRLCERVGAQKRAVGVLRESERDVMGSDKNALVGAVIELNGRRVRVSSMADGVSVCRDARRRIAVRNCTTTRLSYIPEWRLLKAKRAMDGD